MTVYIVCLVHHQSQPAFTKHVLTSSADRLQTHKKIIMCQTKSQCALIKITRSGNPKKFTKQTKMAFYIEHSEIPNCLTLKISNKSKADTWTNFSRLYKEYWPPETSQLCCLKPTGFYKCTSEIKNTGGINDNEKPNFFYIINFYQHII